MNIDEENFDELSKFYVVQYHDTSLLIKVLEYSFYDQYLKVCNDIKIKPNKLTVPYQVFIKLGHHLLSCNHSISNNDVTVKSHGQGTHH